MQIFPYLCTMISQKITSEQLFCAANLLANAQHIVILTHMSPDGDAMGSSLGFRHYLTSMGGNSVVNVTNIVPNAFPSFLAWMPDAEEVMVYDAQPELAAEAMQQADLIVCTDFNEPKRIGALGVMLEQRVQQGCSCLVIDHHLADTQSPFLQASSLAIIDPSAPAACLLVYQLVTQLQARNHIQDLSKQEQDNVGTYATCLYTGLMTDTGNFSFNSNSPELYQTIADLIRCGINKDQIYNAVFNQYSSDRMRLMGYCLNQKMHLFPETHTSLIYLTRRELYRYNFQSGDAEGIVNLPLQIGDVYYSVFMREDKLAPWEKAKYPDAKCKVKISLRSQGDRPVNVFAHDIFNGGGHANASGGEYYGASVAEAVQLFLDNYQSYFKKD